MAIPVLTQRDIKLLRADHQTLKNHVHRLEQWMRWYQAVAGGEGAGGAPATVSSIIPARSGVTPGGPVNCQPLKRDRTTGDLVPAGAEKPIYSWVKTPSADPATEPGGELYIQYLVDPFGTYWFAGQDCTEPATSILQADATADLIVTQTVQAVPGTTLTMPTFHGIYNYTVTYELEITGVQGNQAWDVSIGLYNQTEAQWEAVAQLAGNGDIPYNPTGAASFNFEIDAGNAGDTLVLGAARTTTTGTVTVKQLDVNLGQATSHQITGPL